MDIQNSYSDIKIYLLKLIKHTFLFSPKFFFSSKNTLSPPYDMWKSKSLKSQPLNRQHIKTQQYYTICYKLKFPSLLSYFLRKLANSHWFIYWDPQQLANRQSLTKKRWDKSSTFYLLCLSNVLNCHTRLWFDED